EVRLVERVISAMGDREPANRLDAAVVALRRGEPVLLDDKGHAVLVLAGEFVDDANLARLRAVSGRPLHMVLTRRRAVALGLAALTRVAEARVPLADAEDAQLIAFRPGDGGTEHLAILIGAPDPTQPVLARLHSQCFTGDVLASLRCDCGDQLRGAIAAIAE